MVFYIRAYKDIMEGTATLEGIRNEDGFEDTKATLRGAHHTKTIDTLRQPRRHQVQFIEKTRELLHRSNLTELNKARVMTGLMLLERAIIAKSYNENIFEATTQDLKATKNSEHSSTYKGSLYFRCLAINIGLDSKNPLEYEDYPFFLRKAKLFIESHVYQNRRSRDGFIKEHPFSSLVIPGLDISVYLDMCISISAEAEHLIIERNKQRQAEELRKEELCKKTDTTSWFGGLAALWSSTPQSHSDPTIKEVEDSILVEPSMVFQPQ